MPGFSAGYRMYPTRDWGGPEDTRWRRYLWAYHRMIELVDARVGEILDGIDQRGLAENTFVVFFSDHGDGAARHRWNQKTMFYDECARVPLVIRHPGGEGGGRTDARLVNIGLDLFPTLLGAGGLSVLPHLQGENLLLATPSSARRKFMVSENNLQPKWGVAGKVSGRMVRSER